MTTPTFTAVEMAKGADWGQVVANGGPPCFHADGNRFCLRAQRWGGHEHNSAHAFVSLAELLQQLTDERDAERTRGRMLSVCCEVAESALAASSTRETALQQEVERLRAEVYKWEGREGAVCPEDCSFEQEIARLKKVNAELRKVCIESNAVCCCGCLPEEHENYGEDGEACDKGHECMRTSYGVASVLNNERAWRAIEGLKLTAAESALTAERQKVAALAKAMMTLFEDNGEGPWHEDDCPMDDTCDCSWAHVNAAVTIAYNALTPPDGQPAEQA